MQETTTGADRQEGQKQMVKNLNQTTPNFSSVLFQEPRRKSFMEKYG